MSEELSLSAMQRLIKRAGAERVGEDAVEELSKLLENVGLRVSAKAVELAAHAGRKTVKASDVQIAAKEFIK